MAMTWQAAWCSTASGTAYSHARSRRCAIHGMPLLLHYHSRKLDALSVMWKPALSASVMMRDR